MWKCMANLWSTKATAAQSVDQPMEESPSNLLLNQSKLFFSSKLHEYYFVNPSFIL